MSVASAAHRKGNHMDPMNNAGHNHVANASPTERMRALIESLSAYIEHYHGGWVKLVDFDGAVLKVQLGGACKQCPLTETTLHGWVEGSVRQFFPEIERVEAI
jgi:Fe-S cluster biogenesis protein NfuA